MRGSHTGTKLQKHKSKWIFNHNHILSARPHCGTVYFCLQMSYSTIDDLPLTSRHWHVRDLWKICRVKLSVWPHSPTFSLSNPPPQFSCYGLLSFKAFFIPLGQISCQRGGWSGWCMYQRLGLLEDRAWRLDGRTTTFHAEVSFVHVSYIEQGLTETPFISTQSVFTL